MMGKFQEKRAVLSDGIFTIFALCSGMSGVCILHAVVHYLHTQGFQTRSHDQSADFSASAMFTFRGAI
jgi:hypothetical protein